MQSKKIIPIKRTGTLFKKFDFIVCDLMIHPNISNNKEIISTITNITSTMIKETLLLYFQNCLYNLLALITASLY